MLDSKSSKKNHSSEQSDQQELKEASNTEMYQVESSKNYSVLKSSLTKLTTDWSDAAKEMLESLPQVWTRGLLYLLMFSAAVIIPWSMISKIEETGTGRGRLEPNGSPNRLESAASGTVISVRAKEGDIVEQNQVLLELESDKNRAELQQTQTRLDGQKNRLSQLVVSKNQAAIAINTQQQQNQSQVLEKTAQADQSKQGLYDKKSSTSLVLTSKIAQVNQAKKNLADSESSLLVQQTEKAAQVNQVREKLSSAKTTYTKLNSKFKRNKLEVQRYQNLWKQGGVPQVKVVEIEELFNETDRLRSQAAADVKLAEESLKEQQSNYAKVVSQLQSDVQRNEFSVQEQQREYQKLQKQQGSDITQATIRLREQVEGQKGLKSSGELALSKSREQLNELQSQIGVVETEISQIQIQIQSLQKELEQKVLRAPVKGILVQLPVKQAKSFVQTGQLVAQIAPQSSKTIMRTQIPSQESGFLKVGMPAKVKFDAYPFQDYGVVMGKVQWVSPDSKVSESNGSKAEVFEIDVALDQSYIQNRENRIPLALGQAATVEVVVRQRRVIDFIIDPFKQLQKGGVKM
jgi:hemolysin D